MILPVGAGRQEGIPFPNFNLIVASGHSPLSFTSRHWSPQYSILGTQSLHWTIHTALTHGGVDLASSDGRKMLGVDGLSIVPHWQIQWV